MDRRPISDRFLARKRPFSARNPGPSVSGKSLPDLPVANVRYRAAENDLRTLHQRRPDSMGGPPIGPRQKRRNPLVMLIRVVENDVDPTVFLLPLCARVVGETAGVAESCRGEPRASDTKVIH